ncbi:hypothetical protein V8E55_009008 [Tylopilus felleus]
MPLYFDYSFSHGLPESFTAHSHPSISHHPCFLRGGNDSPSIPIDFALGPDTRPSVHVLSDARHWLPSLSFSSQRVTLEAQFPLVDIGSHVSQALSDETFVFGHTQAQTPQVMLQTQTLPELSSGYFGSMLDRHANLGTNLGPFELSAGGFPPISSDTTEDALNYVSNERQPPAMIYRAPERQGPGHRRSRRPCRIKHQRAVDRQRRSSPLRQTRQRYDQRS